MATRFPSILAAGLLLAGCARSESPAPVPGPAAPAAAAPRPLSDEALFSPVDRTALRTAPRALPPRPSPFPVPGADGLPPDDGDLPPIPVPAGRVPPAEEAGPVFAEEEPTGEDVEVLWIGGSGPAACEEEPGEEVEPEEEVEVESITYCDTVEVRTSVVEIGTPVLVVQGYSSWGCGPFPAVRSSTRFDPCALPYRGAWWEPVAYDPCWNPCGDPAWRSWNSFARACEDRDLESRHRNIGLQVLDDGGGSPVHRARPPAGTPVHDAAGDPAPADGEAGPPLLHGRTAPATREPAYPAPEPISREGRLDFGRGSGIDDGAAAEVSRPRRLIPGARRATAPEADPPPASPAAEPESVARNDEDASASARALAAPAATRRGRDRDLGGDRGGGDDARPAARNDRQAPEGHAEVSREEERRAAPEPARNHGGRGRDDDGRPDPRPAEASRPEPARQAAEGRPAQRDAGSGRSSEPGSPPPAPDPPRHGGGGRHR